jgi:hypothetical protein
MVGIKEKQKKGKRKQEAPIMYEKICLLHHILLHFMPLLLVAVLRHCRVCEAKEVRG